MRIPSGKRIYAFDIENDGPRLTCGCIVGHDYSFQFTEKYQFWNEIQDKRFRNSTIYATNLEYDIGFLMDGMPQERNVELFKRGGRLIFAKFHHNSRNIVTFSDSMNFSLAGVEALGEMIGIPKMEKPNFSPGTPQEMKYLKAYNLNDATITYKFMVMLQAAVHELGGRMRATASSTALYLFRTKYHRGFVMQPSIYADEEMQAYYGGRCEAFARGRYKNARVYDINSMYSAIMASHSFPKASTARRTYDPTLKGEGISFCDIEAPTGLKIPLLPFRKNKLLFPLGTFSGWYCHPELRKARELGYKVTVKESILYDTEPMFRGYVNDLYTLKQKHENNPIMRSVIKLYLNSLYGKFAIKDTVSREVHADELGAQRTADLMNEGHTLDTRGYISFDEPMDKTPSYRQPIISAYITSYARLHLYSFFEKLNHEVLYCDTDSVITQGELPVSGRLGDMKLEFEGDAVIIRPKMYLLHNDERTKIKIKGLGRTIKDMDMFNELIIGRKQVKYKRFAKIRESRRKGLWYCQRIDVHKQMGLEDDKRSWTGEFSTENPQVSEPVRI